MFNHLIQIIRLTLSDFVDDNGPQTAAALTYQTLFAVVPLLTVSYRLLSTFAAFKGLETQIEDLVFSNFLPETGDTVQVYLRDFSNQAQDLTFAGVAVLAITALAMLITIERAFNVIWRIEEPRSGLSRFLLYWAVLTLGPFCIGSALTVSTYVGALPLVIDVKDSFVFLKMVPVLMSTIVFTLIYVAVPNCKVPLLHGLLGGLVVALLFELAKALFILIVAQSSYQVVYGAFAAIPMFLLWVYLAWNLILFGAELVRNMGLPPGIEGSTDNRFLQLLSILEIFSQAQNSGDVVMEDKLCREQLRIRRLDWNLYRRVLLDMKLIQRNQQGELFLARNLSGITLWDFYQQVPWQLPIKGFVGQTGWHSELGTRLERIASANKADLDINLSELFGGQSVTENSW